MNAFMKLQCFFKCILTIASSSLAAFLIATITKMTKSGAFAAFIIGRYPEFWNTPIDINLAWIGIATINLALHGLDLLYSPLIAKFFPSAPSWLFHIPYNAATPDWLSSFLTWHTDITACDLIPFLSNPHDATSYRAYFQLFDYLNTGIGITLAFLTAGLLAGFLTFILIQDLPLAAAGWINWMRAQKAKAQLEALKTMLRKIQRRQLTYEDQDALDEAFTLIH